MFAHLSAFTPWVTQEDRSNQMVTSMPELNVRPRVIINPQEAPDPIRQGNVISRPARVQVATFWHDTEATSDWRFQSAKPLHDPAASLPPGQQHPWDARVNIAVPQHVAYGSLFEQRSYG